MSDIEQFSQHIKQLAEKHNVKALINVKRSFSDLAWAFPAPTDSQLGDFSDLKLTIVKGRNQPAEPDQTSFFIGELLLTPR